MSFDAGPVLTHETARAVLAAGLSHIAAGVTQFDMASLTRFDSSALAVLLAWRRAALARGAELQVLNLPVGLASLARAYGVDPLLMDALPAAPERLSPAPAIAAPDRL